MYYRIWLSNGRFYDVVDEPAINMVNSLVSVRTFGKFATSVQINREHIVSIELMHTYDSKKDGLMSSEEWNGKVKAMDKNKSKKKFKESLKYVQRNK